VPCPCPSVMLTWIVAWSIVLVDSNLSLQYMQHPL
jgi:hypothetical protein